MNHDGAITILKAKNINHVQENANAAEIKLKSEEFKEFYDQMVDGY